MTMGQRLVDAAPNQGTPAASEAGRGRGRVSPGASGGSAALPTP